MPAARCLSDINLDLTAQIVVVDSRIVLGELVRRPAFGQPPRVGPCRRAVARDTWHATAIVLCLLPLAQAALVDKFLPSPTNAPEKTHVFSFLLCSRSVYYAPG